MTGGANPRLNALFVDDEQASYEADREPLRVGFQNLGVDLTIDYCPTIQEALGRLPKGQQTYQLVISDLFFAQEPNHADRVPRYDVIEQAAQTAESTVIVALSVGGEPLYQRLESDARSAGADLFAFRYELLTTDKERRWKALIEKTRNALVAKGLLPGVPVELPLPATLERVVLVSRRFPGVAASLARRRQDRTAFTVEDEYDVQYLLEGLLRVDFEDVRTEVPTPTKLNRSARADFWLPEPGLVVETKRPRDSAHAKRLRTELIEDVSYYRDQPGCRFLVCFVFDPNGLIDNPAGFEFDISRIDPDFRVVGVVAPR